VPEFLAQGRRMSEYKRVMKQRKARLAAAQQQAA
jgi:hypothetical protein